LAAEAPPLEDIQAPVLRDYWMPSLTILVLRVIDATAARTWLGELTVRAAAPWPVEADNHVNLGLTAEGLRALGVPDAAIGSFPEEFRQGAVARAGSIGDTHDGDPEHWIGGLGTPDAHLVVTVYGNDRAVVSGAVDALVTAPGFGPAVHVLSRHDGDALHGSNVTHFGYHEGLSGPTIEGLPAPLAPDPQPTAPLGEFVLGHLSQHERFTYPVPQPQALGDNGTFCVLRISERDVAGFEQFLQAAAAQTGMSVELVAATLMGRWRNGMPLALSPDTDTPAQPIPAERQNAFDYVDDPRGERCPIGSHIRRVNPRGSRIAGGGGHLHRLVRRGMPYGPPFDPTKGDDGQERGSLSLFFNVSIADQFEFVMRDWIDGETFAPGLRGSRCPIAGSNDPATSSFFLGPPGKDRAKLAGFGRFSTTRGAAYCFVPSLTGLRWLSSLGADEVGD
jgi:deferrochelatase/peroxidase EfeB